MSDPTTTVPGTDTGHAPGDARFTSALAHFPSGVTIVTTVDSSGTPHGFTATSFCSVSLDPPLICVCVAHTARSHRYFDGARPFTVSFLTPGHTELARRFASKADDKFGGGGFRHTHTGGVVVEGALAVLDCATYSRHDAGDHTMLVGRVRRVELGEGEPLVFCDRTFHRLAELR
ncbi:flavin reductase family protein [Saccharomonospora saliphila]|uniref:flavin reductase family protein n=1 Tax=Saccharomonospora saliphila TaxID=369829 RepID=UPI00036D6304|nr:flavin reductase family protein [Saccharomonospora saliphila]